MHNDGIILVFKNGCDGNDFKPSLVPFLQSYYLLFHFPEVTTFDMFIFWVYSKKSVELLSIRPMMLFFPS